MTDAILRFSVKWAGSNIKIASLAIPATNPGYFNNSRLQEQVGALANIDPRHIKILLTSPAGPQLTPVLFPSALVRAHAKIEDVLAHKAMVEAWSSLTTDLVFNVYVTQHSPVDLAVDMMARLLRSNRYKKYAYTKLPLSLRQNPVVALAALDASRLVDIHLPDELKNNKKFALAVASRQYRYGYILQLFSSNVCDDEEVVLKAVASNAEELWYASRRLKNTKSFMLQAVSVNGLCICYALKSDKDVALAAVRQSAAAFYHLCDTLKTDKDFALAAVRQNTAAFHYLCDTLRADKDIQKVIDHS
jgi:hypothetical protein